MGVDMDIKKQNAGFSIEQLLNGSMAKNQFKVDYLPLWHFIDNMERKTQGFKNPDGSDMQMGKVIEAAYEFGVISTGLEKADMTTRIDNLNEQNLRWFNKANALELENKALKERISELEKK